MLSLEILMKLFENFPYPLQIFSPDGMELIYK